VPLSSEYRSALDPQENVLPLRDVVREAERAHLDRVLRLTHGRRIQAADLLGISRKQLWEKIRDHGLDTGGVAGSSDDEKGSE
jgi:DNA-binding NtrC family response regulator